MATYIYRCEFCGHEIEVRRNISAYRREIEYICPKCACNAVMQSVPQPAGFHLKGGGWESRGRGAGGQI